VTNNNDKINGNEFYGGDMTNILPLDIQFLASFVVQVINMAFWVFIIIFAVRVYRLAKIKLEEYHEKR